jgi:hypothetical protein
VPKDHSVQTIKHACETFLTQDLPFTAIRETDKGRSVSSSNGQEFLNGLEYELGGTWYNGHLTLSPMEGPESGYFDSAHLTIVGSGPYVGNWGFTVAETGTTGSVLPKKFRGNDSKNGNELPSPAKEDVIKLLDRIALFD